MDNFVKENKKFQTWSHALAIAFSSESLYSPGLNVNYKIEFALNNLMMTSRTQESMNTTINCQVRLISKNEVKAR